MFAEYTSRLYRQFVLYLGSLIFPAITLIGLVANVLEYYLGTSMVSHPSPFVFYSVRP